MGAIALAISVALFAGREQLRIPGNVTDDTVVARLGTRATPYPGSLREAVRAAWERPDDPTAAVAAARQYLDHGRAVGDARFAGAALGMLTPWLDKSDPEILRLAADARQYGHDFDGAVELLDAALNLNPLDAQALLSRANIKVVRGRFREAEEDCKGLARARRGDLAILCDTTVKALLAEAPAAYERLDRMVAIKAMDPALLGYAHSLLAEMARFLDAPDKAGPHFASAQALSPTDLRTLMIRADFELSRQAPAKALELLAAAPETDSILVRRAEAHAALGNAKELDALKVDLSRRFEERAQLGETAHAREAARFWLNVGDQPDFALVAAQANWASQRELEDALLLLAAARQAGKPEAARPVLDWAEQEGVVAPMFIAAREGMQPK